MNIFNRKNDDDDLPGRQAMPRPTLPPVEEQLGDMVRDQYRKRPQRTAESLAIELETNAASFDAAVNDAEEAAKAYCATYAELETEITAKLEAIETQRKKLRALQASLPRVEKPNEQADSNSSTDSDDNASPGQDPVPAKPITGLVKPLRPNTGALPPNRR